MYLLQLKTCITLLAAYLVLKIFRKRILLENNWLIQEKRTEARDNGYHLFKYLREKYPDLPVHYIITSDSADYPKVSRYSNIIEADSFRHYLYYLAAKYSISSQPYGAAPYPSGWIYHFRRLCRKDQKVIFLQHGIIKDTLPELDYSKTGFDLFVCSAIPELNYVWKDLHYPKQNAKLLGLCRFDNLYNTQTKNIILIMPTFRLWLKSKQVDKEATEYEEKLFRKSAFYQHYCELLTNERLKECMKEYGYTLVFYLHYALQSYTKSFSSCSNRFVTIADRHSFDVQQLLIDSKLLVTDYSSVFFDFAYMGKTVAFLKFDEKEFRRKHRKHYQNGYFDYDMNGFGPVYTKSEDVIEYMVQMMQTGCVIEDKYLQRIKAFFPFHDQNNCKRTFEAISAL